MENVSRLGLDLSKTSYKFTVPVFMVRSSFGEKFRVKDCSTSYRRLIPASLQRKHVPEVTIRARDCRARAPSQIDRADLREALCEATEE